LGSWFKSYGVLKISALLWHALSHCQCSKFCPKLPKFAQRQNFEISPKIEILLFFKNKKLVRVEEALEHVSTIRIFSPRIFHMLFLFLKNGLCM
jgi:hypothetical protein